MPVRIVTSVSPESNPFDDIDLDDLLEGVPNGVAPPRVAPTPYIAVADSKTHKGLGAADRWGDLPPSYEVRHLDAALAGEYGSDAHCVPYVVVDALGRALWEQPRINIAGLPQVRSAGYDVKITSFWADVDNPDHAPWTRALLEQTWPKALRAETASVYTSRSGLRIVQPLTSWLSVEEFAPRHQAWLRAIEGQTGLAVDTTCKDWTRHYRLPLVVRDGAKTRSHRRPEWTAIDPPAAPPAPKPNLLHQLQTTYRQTRQQTSQPTHRQKWPQADISLARRYAAAVPVPVCGSGVGCNKVTQRLACKLATPKFGLGVDAIETILTEWWSGGGHEWRTGDLRRKADWAVAKATMGGA